ncbi:MAG: carboxypeptidase regulatory-like domain-containing protein [Planctomycetes bacterium]|nr:carboxypeptidase regulatory-like domain-containing protein [Planctomycetota bacterium]
MNKITLLLFGSLVVLCAWLMWPQQNTAGSSTKEQPAVIIAEAAAPALTLPIAAVERTELEPVELALEAEEAIALRKEDIPPGVITGRIVDSEGIQIFEGRVVVLHNDEQLGTFEISRAQSDFRFELPGREHYWVKVESDSLSGGYITELSKQFIDLQPSANENIELTVSLSANASGRVLNPDGQPVSGVLVRLVGIDAIHGSIAKEDVTKEDGTFAMNNLFPGNQRLQIFVDEAMVPENKNWNPPSPTDYLLRAGSAFDFGDIYLGTGMKTIRGRLVNQDGNAFAGMQVMCYSNEEVAEGATPHNWGSNLSYVLTDEHGYFELLGLPDIPVSLSITPLYTPGKVLGAGHAAMWEPKIDVDLRDSSNVVDIGEYTVDESRPFVIEGNLIFDEGWLAAKGHSRSDLSMALNQAKGEKLPEGVRRASVNRQRIRLQKNASDYRHLVETPMTTLLLRIKLKGYENLYFELHPEPFQNWSRDIHIPSDFQILK